VNAPLLILNPGSRLPWAQAQRMLAPPTPLGAAIGGLISLALAVLVVGLIAATVSLYQQRRRRHAEARELERQLSAAFLRDPRLTGIVLTPTIRIPLSPGRPMEIAIAGAISRAELRAVVLQIAREETKYSEGETVLEDRLTVSSTVPPVAA